MYQRIRTAREHLDRIKLENELMMNDIKEMDLTMNNGYFLRLKNYSQVISKSQEAIKHRQIEYHRLNEVYINLSNEYSNKKKNPNYFERRRGTRMSTMKGHIGRKSVTFPGNVSKNDVELYQEHRARRSTSHKSKDGVGIRTSGFLGLTKEEYLVRDKTFENDSEFQINHSQQKTPIVELGQYQDIDCEFELDENERSNGHYSRPSNSTKEIQSTFEFDGSNQYSNNSQMTQATQATQATQGTQGTHLSHLSQSQYGLSNGLSNSSSIFQNEMAPITAVSLGNGNSNNVSLAFKNLQSPSLNVVSLDRTRQSQVSTLSRLHSVGIQIGLSAHGVPNDDDTLNIGDTIPISSKTHLNSNENQSASAYHGSFEQLNQERQQMRQNQGTLDNFDHVNTTTTNTNTNNNTTSTNNNNSKVEEQENKNSGSFVELHRQHEINYHRTHDPNGLSMNQHDLSTQILGENETNTLIGHSNGTHKNDNSNDNENDWDSDEDMSVLHGMRETLGRLSMTNVNHNGHSHSHANTNTQINGEQSVEHERSSLMYPSLLSTDGLHSNSNLNVQNELLYQVPFIDDRYKYETDVLTNKKQLQDKISGLQNEIERLAIDKIELLKATVNEIDNLRYVVW